MNYLLSVVLLGLLLTRGGNAQLSRPMAHDSHYTANKYSLQNVVEADEILFGTSVEHRTNGTAKYGLGISWATEVGSSVYATPTIIDLYSDGRKEIIVPTFTHYLEIIDGQAGDDVKGWPFTHTSLNTHCSVVPVDLDADGTQELMYTTEQGELLFFEENGRAMIEKTVRIPPLKVRRTWYKLAANADADHEKHLDDSLRKRHEKLGTPHRKWGVEWSRNNHVEATPETLAPKEETQPPQEPKPNIEESVQPSTPRTRKPRATGRRLHQINEVEDASEHQINEVEDASEHNPYSSYGDYMEDDDMEMSPGMMQRGGPPPAVPGTDGWLSAEARESMDLVFHANLFKQFEDNSRKLATADDVLFVRDEFNAKYDNNAPENKEYVWVDAHVLATPVVADLEMDGSLEAIVAVTYFFDQEMMRKNNITLPEDVEPSNYVAGGIVVISILTGEVKWAQQLDLSTDNVKYKANVYSSPVVIDVDRDGSLDVIVTTSMGFVYVFNAAGKVKQGWPRVMAEIQASVLVEDVNGDGNLDICAADFQSNVVCFNADGTEIWEARASGGVAQALVAGDVNADGEIDIVFGTTTGQIWALSGRSGKRVKGFPVKCKGRIYSPALLVHLEGSVPSYGLHIIVTTHDGYLYVVDGQHTANFEMMDIGEVSYSMVLADDLNGNGNLDLVVATMNGNVFLIDTKTPWHPLKAWTSFPHGLNVATAREGVGLAIYVSPESRVYRDVVGDHFKIMFHIQDNRESVTKGMLAPTYHVVIKLGHRLIVHKATYSAPGTYIEFVSTPLQRMYSSVVIMLLADSSQIFIDSFSLSFNMHFHTSLKWAFLVPFIAVSVALMFVKQSDSVQDEEELLAQYYRARMSPMQPQVQNREEDSDEVDEDGASPDAHLAAQRL